MTPIGGRHVGAFTELTRLVAAAIGSDLRVSVQSPIHLADDSEPQPDIAVYRFRRELLRELPTAEDVLLIVEVAESSLQYDHERKLPLYGRAGIPEAWIVDLVNHRIERHSQPGPYGYQATLRAERGQEMRSLVPPEIVVPVDAVIG